ncbi:MAG: Card1-like endonuclease domain-containing protein [Clostridium sp.]
MKFNTIVNFVDEHNEGGIILAKKFSVTKVILIDNNFKNYDIEGIENIYRKVIPNINIETIKLIEYDYNEIEKIVVTYSSEDIIFNLTGGERIVSLMFHQYLMKNNLMGVYIDVLNKKLFYFTDNVKTTQEDIIDLDIEDITHAAGAEILVESTNMLGKKDLIEITKQIQINLPIWHKYKQRLYDNSTFEHDYKNTNLVIVHKSKLNNDEYKIVKGCLEFLEKLKSIEILETEEKIDITFLNSYLKGFIFKSGTWLEVFTNIAVNEIKEIDETKSGVLFFWNNDAKVVKNELDVVAIKDSILICISCKDSDKYDEDALNELSIYAKKLGGDNAKKILVATKKPLKTSLIQRAKQMNISIIILEKDINKFKKELNIALK